MSAPDLVPTRATYAPEEPVVLEWTAPVPARLVVRRLGSVVLDRTVEASDSLDLGPFPEGGYAVRLTPEGGGPDVCTAFDVLVRPADRPRYGFLSEFSPGRTPEETAHAARGLRELHLNVVQLYDWAYRHADLLGVAEEFVDPCGRTLSHGTTRRVVAACHDVGALALGYAAVYGVGKDYAAAHPDQLLYHRDGTPWDLGDLLLIGNLAPGNRWRDHILAEFARAFDGMPFDGFHLDTYGTPKVAWDHDGEAVDLSEVFPAFLARVREVLPQATLFFNNVNDYPTWTTAAAPLDSTYVEVWDPHREYRHLVALVESARLSAPGRPVVLAAYLAPFAEGVTLGAQWAARLALATVFAHGGHYLLCGEGDGVLTHPYYPNFVRVDEATRRLLRDYLDFAVANGDLLYAPEGRTVTHAHLAGDENDDLQVRAAVPVVPDPRPGCLWVVARRSRLGLDLHLLDLSAQDDLEWNRGKAVGGPTGQVEVRVRWSGERVLFGSPELGPDLTELPVRREGDHLVTTVPAFTAWAVLHLPR